MASYNTILKDWGASGSAYPDGYSYLEGEQPVDEWDNFLMNEIINDVKDHLIPLTNQRIETDYGNSGAEPASPEESHLYHDQSANRLEAWDGGKGAWRDLLFRDGDTMTGELDIGNNPISGVTNITDENSNLIYDYSNSHIEQSILENDTVTIEGNSVSLGGSTTFNHNDLSSISTNDHHSKTSSSSELSDVSADSNSNAHHEVFEPSDYNPEADTHSKTTSGEIDHDATTNRTHSGDTITPTAVETGEIDGNVVNRTEPITNLAGDIYVTQEGTADPTQHDGDLWFTYQ